MKHIGIMDSRTRLIVFFCGLPLIALGGFGIVAHAPWGDVSNSIFAIFGMMMSFAQFAIGFSSLKPAESGATPTISADALPKLPSSSGARLIGPTGQLHLGVSQILIGRAPDNQYVIDDSQASRYHAVIRPEGPGFVLVDLGSANGTWLNEHRLEAKVPRVLYAGDLVRIGNTKFTYQTGAAPALPPAVLTLIPPPPPAYTQQPGSHPFSAPPGLKVATQQRYVGSAIAFLLSGLLNFLTIPLGLLAKPGPATNVVEEALFVLIYVIALFGIRGLNRKQASKAGKLGMVGILTLAAGWILNVIVGLAICAAIISTPAGQQVPQGIIKEIQILYTVNALFIVAGDIVLAISMIRAAVYPLWTGIILLIIASMNVLYYLAPIEAIALSATLLVTVLYCAWSVVLLQQPDHT